MGKAVPWLAGLIAVIAGVVAVARWIDRHQPHHYNASGVGAAVICASLLLVLGSGRLSARVMGYERTQTNVRLVTAACALALIALIVGGRRFVPDLVISVLTVICVGSVISYHVREARRKVCPDCAESIKAAARVCRYCGYRFHSNIEPVASADPVSLEQRRATPPG
jgi:hypothetical protein